jgi:AmmeMemoRadiSam system protein B
MCAHNFYYGDVAAQVAAFLQGFEAPAAGGPVLAAFVPHAGWVFSGRVAARVFATLRQRNPGLRALVVLGAVHVWNVHHIAVCDEGEWATPVGRVTVDTPLARRIAEATEGLAEVRPQAHENEHSIEVQCPMLRVLFPGVGLVPIMVPPGDDAVSFGQALAKVLAQEPEGRVAVVASTDLTHYGAPYGFAPAGSGPKAQAWMEANDARLLDLALGLKAREILPEAAAHHNACGAGALAATVAYAAERGAGAGALIEYTTSFREHPDDEFRMAVGYAGGTWGA